MQAMWGHQEREAVSCQTLIKLEGLLVDQPHLNHGRMQGIEQQVAGLGHHHRMQYQVQLLLGPQQISTKYGTGEAMEYGS